VCFDLRKCHSFELLGTVTILLAMGFVAFGGVGGWVYWNRVELRGEQVTRDELAPLAAKQIPQVFGYDYQTVERSLNEVYPLLTRTIGRSSRTARTRTSSRRRVNASWSVRPTW